MNAHYDVIVVGSGPAGLGAAAVTANAGLETLVVDEYPVPGGRLLGQLHEEPSGTGSRWWKGAEVAAQMVTEVRQAGATIACGTDVWGVFPVTDRPGWRVCLARGHVDTVTTDHVVIATGAGERGVPLPGWELPGVMTVGGAQVMANVHRVRPGDRALVVGVDVLALTIARELALAGVEVVGMMQAGPLASLDRWPSPRAEAKAMLALAHLAPAAWMRMIGPAFRGGPFPELVARLYPKRGIPVWGIPVHLRRACLEIIGSDTVEGAVVADLDVNGRVVDGTERRMDIDCVAVSGGLYPMIELAAALGCKITHIAELGGHVPVHDVSFVTTAQQVYVAGSIVGVEGASIAAAQGRAAGTSLAHRAGRLEGGEREVRAALADVEEARRQAPFTFLPDVGAGRQRMQTAWEQRHV